MCVVLLSSSRSWFVFVIITKWVVVVAVAVGGAGGTFFLLLIYSVLGKYREKINHPSQGPINRFLDDFSSPRTADDEAVLRGTVCSPGLCIEFAPLDVLHGGGGGPETSEELKP